MKKNFKTSEQVVALPNITKKLFSLSFALFLIITTFTQCKEIKEDRALNIFAASSLTDAFGELKKSFELSYSGVNVSMNFAGSQVLRLQIEEGAKADVFASADESHIDALMKKELINEKKVFTHNELAVIVPLENRAGLKQFSDLVKAQRIVIGAANVPVGIYTRELLKKAASQYGKNFEETVLKNVVSLESNVRLVRAKVELGEADAALVYRSDVWTIPHTQNPHIQTAKFKIITIDESLNVQAAYYFGVLKKSKNIDIATKWSNFLLSEAAQNIMGQYGFLPLKK